MLAGVFSRSACWSMSEVIIRPARLADLPELLTLWRQLQDINASMDPRLALSDAAPDWMADFLRGQMDNENAALLVAVTGPGTEAAPGTRRRRSPGCWVPNRSTCSTWARGPAS